MVFVSVANAVPVQSLLVKRKTVTFTSPTSSDVSPRPMVIEFFPPRGSAAGVELFTAPLVVFAEALMHWVRVSFSNTTVIFTRPRSELQPASRRMSQGRSLRDVIRAASV